MKRLLGATLVTAGLGCSMIQGLRRSEPDERAYSLFQHADLQVGAGAGLVALAASTDGKTLFALEGSGLVHLLDAGAKGESLSVIDRLDLRLDADEEAVGMSLDEPRGELLVVTRARTPGAPGALRRHALEDGRLLSRLGMGRSTSLARSGRRIVVASSASLPIFDETERTFTRHPGELTLADLSEPTLPQTFTVPVLLESVPDITGPSDGRLERLPVDWNGDGASTPDVDFDGDGRIADDRVLLGSFEGATIYAGEHQGEFVDFPVAVEGRAIAGPHDVLLTADGSLAYAAFPARNAVVAFNLEHATVARIFGMGLTRHAADVRNDGVIAFDDELVAWREPVALDLAQGDRLLVTADGGWTHHAESNAPAGGGRTVSVFDARTGQLVGDTGGELDRLAALVDGYRDATSEGRGSRPTCVSATSLRGRPLAVVGLRDAGAVGLVTLDLEHPPRVAAMTTITSSTDEAQLSPVDLAVLLVGARCLVAAATREGHVALVEVLCVE